jgi:hypothetical protein
MKKFKNANCFELQCASAVETVATLQARKSKLEQSIKTFDGKDDALSRAEIRASRAEIREIDNLMALDAARAENKTFADQRKAKIEADATFAIECMKKTGEIPVRDEDKAEEYRKMFLANPDSIPLMAGKAIEAAKAPVVPTSTPTTRNMRGGIQVGADFAGALKHMALTCGKTADKDQSLAIKFEAAREIGAIYKREIAPLIAKGEYFPLEAADYSGGGGTGDASANLGILSGTLVAQRTLDLYKLQFPVLGAITTDFSDQPAQYMQTTSTRIIVVPAVLSYDSTTDATGRPKGYTIVTPAQTVDAPIVLNKHRAVDVVFDANTLASTTRNLFAEQAEANAYALGLDVVTSLYSNITAANFAANPAFTVPIINYGRPTFSKVKRVFNLQGVPFSNRFALSSSYMQEQLEQDPTLVSLAVYQKPEIITDAELPQINRFQPYEAPNLPATAIGNATLAAFFAHKTALLMQSRIPNDWSTVLGPNSGYGQVSVVTNADTGLSVLLVRFSNPQSAHAEYRLALIYGTAPGNTKGGQIVTN